MVIHFDCLRFTSWASFPNVRKLWEEYYSKSSYLTGGTSTHVHTAAPLSAAAHGGRQCIVHEPQTSQTAKCFPAAYYNECILTSLVRLPIADKAARYHHAISLARLTSSASSSPFNTSSSAILSSNSFFAFAASSLCLSSSFLSSPISLEHRSKNQAKVSKAHGGGIYMSTDNTS